MKTNVELNYPISEIIKAAIRVHKELGPGLLESVYQRCMIIELEAMGHKVTKARGEDEETTKYTKDAKGRIGRISRRGAEIAKKRFSFLSDSLRGRI